MDDGAGQLARHKRAVGLIGAVGKDLVCDAQDVYKRQVLHRRASEGCNRCDEGQREKFVNVTVVILFVVRVVAAV